MGRIFAIAFFDLAIIAVIVIIIVGSIVYTKLYNAKINRQLKQGITTGRQWPKPETVVLLIFAFCLLAVIVVDNACNGQVQSTGVRVNDLMDYVSYSSNEIDGTVYEQYTKAFETGELAGYEKVEKTENNFHYIYFISEKEYSILYPKFIIRVEYIGDEKAVGYMDSCRIHRTEDTSYGSAGGGDVADYYYVIGNMKLDEIVGFNYKLGVYDSVDKMSKSDPAINDGEQDWSQAIDYISIWID